VFTFRAKRKHAPLRVAAKRIKIALPKTRSGRYTPSSLVDCSHGPEGNATDGGEALRLEMRAGKNNMGARQQPSSAVCWGLRECQHYPPSWVEASTSLGRVVSGSATPASASQWSSCRTGSRAFAPGSRGYTRSVRNREQTRTVPYRETSKRTPFRTGRLPGSLVTPSIQPFHQLAQVLFADASGDVFDGAEIFPGHGVIESGGG